MVPRPGNRRHGRATRGGSGTRTQVVTRTNAHEASASSSPPNATSRQPPPVLKLRRRRRVRWTKDTHDNEHDGKKSSKSCCIYHRTRAWDESATESGDDSPCEDEPAETVRDDETSRRTRRHRGEETDSSSSGGPVRHRLIGRRLPVVEQEECEEDDGFFD